MDIDWSNPDNLPASASHYDGQNTVYYRGDGIRTAVGIPAGKRVVSIQPPHQIDPNPNLPNDVLFFECAIPNNELLTITLADKLEGKAK